MTKRFYKIIAVTGISLQFLSGWALQAQNNFRENVGKKSAEHILAFDKYQQKIQLPSNLRLRARDSFLFIADERRNKAILQVAQYQHIISIQRNAFNQPFAVVAPNHYTVSFGFFCRQELKIEKATSIPFRFRLGSLAACNAVEGK